MMTIARSKKPGVLSQISAIRQELVEQFTVKRIGVFGSCARGDEGPKSDVDIIVELDVPTFDHYMDLKFRLEEMLRRPVDLAPPDRSVPPGKRERSDRCCI